MPWDQITHWVPGHETMLLFVLDCLLIIPAASIISRKHFREVYMLWYTFSFFFLLFFALNVAALGANQELRDYLGSYAFIYDWLTNSSDELVLVGGIIYLGIGPQLLTYFLSGLFGSASLPIFVRQIQAFAILSLVKFLVGLSGITFAAAFASQLFAKAVPASDLRLGLPALGFAFVLAAFYFCGPRSYWDVYLHFIGWLSGYYLRPFRWVFLRLPPEMRDDTLLEMLSPAFVVRLGRFTPPEARWLRQIHRFFTRHSEPTETVAMQSTVSE